MDTTTLTITAAGVKAGIPVLLWGDPGIGKTSSLEAIFPAWGYSTETITGNVREPSDFAGLPVRNEDGSMTFAAPAWAVRASEAKSAVVILDELSTSTPAVQAAMLRVVLDRYAGDLYMGDHVRFVAAANPPEKAADGYDLSPPLANRFLHLDVDANPETWVTGMTLGWESVTPKIDDLNIVEPDAERIAQVASQFAAYIRNRPNVIKNIPEDAAEMGRAYPTPRTWAMAARIFAFLPDDDINTRVVALSGLVGEGAAHEFMVWLREADLPEPKDVLDDPSIYIWDDPKMDRTFAVLSGVVAYLSAQDKVSEDLAHKGYAVLAAAAAAGRADLSAAAWSMMQKVDGIASVSIPTSFAEALAPIVGKMGRTTARGSGRRKNS